MYSVLKRSKHYHCQQRDEWYCKEKRTTQEIRKRLVKVFRDASRWKMEGGVRNGKERVYDTDPVQQCVASLPPTGASSNMMIHCVGAVCSWSR
jgi:hypothetical protein